MMMKTCFPDLMWEDNLWCVSIVNGGRCWQYLVCGGDQKFSIGGTVLAAEVMGAEVMAPAGRTHHASSCIPHYWRWRVWRIASIILSFLAVGKVLDAFMDLLILDYGVDSVRSFVVIVMGRSTPPLPMFFLNG